VQQALVVLDARLGQRALVAGKPLLRVDPVERTGDVGDAPVLLLQQKLRGEVPAEFVVETETVIRKAAHLAIHDHERRGVVIVIDEEFVRQPLDVDDQRVAIAAHEKTDRLALLCLVVVARRDQHEFSSSLQRLFDGAQHGAEKRAVQLRDQDAHRIGTARGQRLRDGIGPVAKLLHGVENPLPGLVADLGAGIDDSRNRGQRDARQLRDFIDVSHYLLCALQY
jgi:hypothetical protein